MGILILLSFLLVKSVPLFAADNCGHNLSTYCIGHDAADETSDTEKELQQLEITDEDFIQESINIPGYLMLTKKTTFFNIPRINTPYITLPYPPPNGR